MHKEHISALMDGETLDNSVLQHLEQEHSLQQTWESYHLIRDVIRGDIGKVVHFDISARIMAAVSNEPLYHSASIDNQPSISQQPLIDESQPVASQWRNMPWWRKFQAGLGQIAQVAVAASVALAVIVGVHHYGGQSANTPSSNAEDKPAFYTLPIIAPPSQVSLSAPSPGIAGSGQQQIQKQQRRLNSFLKDYELQRRLYSKQLQSTPAGTTIGSISSLTSDSALDTTPGNKTGDTPAGNRQQ